MSTRNRVPALLEEYIKLPPEASLLLLTGVIDATPHWITTRFLSRFLAHAAPRRYQNGPDDAAAIEHDQEDAAVILVSWMRDLDCWKTEARRGAGLDLSRLAADKRFAFIDGLSSLFLPSLTGSDPPKSQQASSARNTTLPTRTGPPPQRSPAPARGPPPASATQSTISPSATQTSSKATTTGVTTITNPALASTADAITSAITSLQTRSRKVFLILDAPTLLLATNPDITPTALSSFVLSLRAQVHSTLLVAEADAPFLAAAAPDAFFSAGDYLEARKEDVEGRVTPLESNHAAFLVGMAHQARWVMGVRPLETGVARDVSGVVAVRRGGAWDEGDEEVSEARSGVEVEVKEMEALYRVAMDGGVKVFERGAGDVG
ncbi:Hypothetical protein D9617_22g066440 [Elsinoe fawcettii]|nr:Hypothetical protein D9617_22g066440 [Elsinoe fawcettii]